MRQRLLKSPSVVSALLLAVASVIVATLAALGLQGFFSIYTLSNLYLLSVLGSALYGGISGGLLAAFLSFLSYNYYFIPPRFTLFVTDPNDLFALFMFLVAALITGGLAGKIREYYDAVERRSDEMQAIAVFSSRMSATSTIDDILHVLSIEIKARWPSRHWIVALDQDHVECVLNAAGGAELPDPLKESLKAMAAHHDDGVQYPHGTYLCIPIKRKDTVPYGLVVDGQENDLLDPEDHPLLETMLAQTAIAMERAAFAQESQRARAAEHEERLRASLLSSVSHDLRTPLASIMGSASTLRQFNQTLEEKTRLELAEAIEDEATRLSRFVDQLLLLARTDHAMSGAREWLDPAEIVYSAVARARRYFDRHVISMHIQPDAPTVLAYPSLLDQSLFNIIENAAKYSPVGSHIRVELRADDAALEIVVTDEGPGILLKDQKRIFDKFIRLDPTGPRTGSGLGLTISRNIAHLMKASLLVESPVKDGKGSRFIMRFLAADHIDHYPAPVGIGA